MAKKSSRTEENTNIQRVNPSFLSQYVTEDTSLQGMDEYRIVPRLKVIQSMTDRSLKDRFGEGSAIIRPGDMLVAQLDQPFLFVPQFFFVEFCKWSDRRDTDSKMIVDRTFDPTSQLALCAKDPKRREEIYEEDRGKDKPRRYRYVEHLNFIGVIYGDHELNRTPITVSFFRGEYFNGMNFINAIKLRKERDEEGNTFTPPLWSQVWQMTPAGGPKRQNADGSWFGLDFSAPDEPALPYIQDDEVPEFMEAHKELVDLHEKKRLVVDHNSAGAEEDLGPSEEVKNSGKF